MKNNRSLIVSSLLALGVLAGGVAPAQATLLLANGSFEDTPIPSSYGTYCYHYQTGCAVASWSATGNTVLIDKDSGPWGTPATGQGNYTGGEQLVGLQGASTIAQAVSQAAGNYLYQLTWIESGRSGFDGNSFQSYPANYDVFFAGVKLNASAFNTTVGQTWTSRSLSFSADHTGELRFAGNNTGRDGTAFIDDVVLTSRAAQVPEPQSLALVALALLGLGAARRRQRSR